MVTSSSKLQTCRTVHGVSQHENIIPKVKWGGRSFKVWGFAVSGPGFCHGLLQDNVRVAVHQLRRL
uniref:Uncharacterized protein n=1 Tax=Seriola dumerili TaxID=41447 RepID=A0A3B4TIP9_SERDU